jgi:hypothetical protein
MVGPKFRTAELRQFLPGSYLLIGTGEPQALSGSSGEQKYLDLSRESKEDTLIAQTTLVIMPSYRDSACKEVDKYRQN